MGLLETIKDTVSIIQKADNLDLYKQILDIQKQALDQQEEIQRLREENRALKKKAAEKKKIVRHGEAVITLKGEQQVYCATCYGKDDKLIQMVLSDKCYYCPNCQMPVHLPID